MAVRRGPGLQAADRRSRDAFAHTAEPNDLLDDEATDILFSVAGSGDLPAERGAAPSLYEDSEGAGEAPYWATWGIL